MAENPARPSEPGAEPPAVLCQMCGVAGRPNETHCRECGAALPLLETVGDLVIPGVTHLDPDLELYARQPLRLGRKTTTEVIAPGAVHAAVVLGGPAGLAALGAIAAVAASELSSRAPAGQNVPPDRLGEPNAVVLEMAQRLQKERAERGLDVSAESEVADDGPA